MHQIASLTVSILELLAQVEIDQIYECPGVLVYQFVIWLKIMNDAKSVQDFQYLIDVSCYHYQSILVYID